ncbi:unnamed protein product, partial [Durusdinium trenchii]
CILICWLNVATIGYPGIYYEYTLSLSLFHWNISFIRLPNFPPRLALLQHPHLGLVDSMGELFLSLHGHRWPDLERALCHENYWAKHPPPPALGPGEVGGGGRPKQRRWPRPRWRFPGQPPRLQREAGEGERKAPREMAEAPSILHFNGNGKRVLFWCIRAFQQTGILSGKDGQGSQCTFYNEDVGLWRRYTARRPGGLRKRCLSGRSSAPRLWRALAEKPAGA